MAARFLRMQAGPVIGILSLCTFIVVSCQSSVPVRPYHRPVLTPEAVGARPITSLDAFPPVLSVCLSIGVAVVCLGLCLIGFALLAPRQPSPSLNEQLGLAWAIGVMIAFGGLVTFTVGLAIRLSLKQEAKR
jgi:hypothetical protein